MEKVKFISEDLVGNDVSIETIKKANEMIVIPTFIDETWLKKHLIMKYFIYGVFLILIYLIVHLIKILMQVF